MSSMSLSMGDAVSWAFDVLGGDPEGAVTAAKGWSYDGWVASQAAQAGAAGAIAAIVPGVHIPALVADLAIVLHKMAYCSWGIGEICDCVVLGRADFQNILAIWSGSSTPEELPVRAISKSALAAAVVGGSAMVGGLAVATVAGTAIGQQVLLQLAQQGGQLAAQQLLMKVGGKAAAKVALATSGQLGLQLGATLGGKLAPKVGAKVGSKMAAKGVLGWIPLVGAGASAAINVYFVTSIASAARSYYSKAEKAAHTPLQLTGSTSGLSLVPAHSGRPGS